MLVQKGHYKETDQVFTYFIDRGTIACVRLAKAWAFLQGRNYVIPDDVTDIFADVAKHRIVLNTKARIGHVTVDATLQEILSDVDKPTTYKRLRG